MYGPDSLCATRDAVRRNVSCATNRSVTRIARVLTRTPLLWCFACRAALAICAVVSSSLCCVGRLQKTEIASHKSATLPACRPWKI